MTTTSLDASASRDVLVSEKQILFDARSALGTVDICLVFWRDVSYLKQRGVSIAHLPSISGVQVLGVPLAISFGVAHRGDMELAFPQKPNDQEWVCRYAGESIVVKTVPSRMIEGTVEVAEEVRIMDTDGNDKSTPITDTLGVAYEMLCLMSGFVLYGKGYNGVTIMRLQEGQSSHLPIPTPADHPRIFLSALPLYLDWDAEYPPMLFGQSTTTTSEQVGVLFKPSPGMGQVYGDGEHRVIQVHENNVYVLYSFAHFEKADDALLTRLMTAICNCIPAYDTALTASDPTPRLPISADEGQQLWKEEMSSYGKHEYEAREKISRLESELVSARRALEDIRFLRQTAVGRLAGIRQSLEESFRVIQAHPMVASLCTVSGLKGFEVETRTVYIDHEKQRYEIGEFRIRLTYAGKYAVYPIRGTHPKGVPHPHMSTCGTMCHGNISQQIVEALSDMRYADAVEYLILWLTQGYEPTSVHFNGHFVEEWPTFQGDVS